MARLARLVLNLFTRPVIDSHRVQWPTREPRPMLYLPKTLIVDDWRSLK